MTKAQKAEARVLLEKDCKVAHCYFDRDGDTCAIGCLAVASGFTEKDFIGRRSDFIHKADMRDIARSIMDKFGFTIEQLVNIQLTNDNELDVETRRGKVLLFVDQIPTVD